MINKENSNNNRIQDLKVPYIFHFFKYTQSLGMGLQKKGNFICYDFFLSLYEYARKTSIYYKLF